jgi:hypothetical protein
MPPSSCNSSTAFDASAKVPAPDAGETICTQEKVTSPTPTHACKPTSHTLPASLPACLSPSLHPCLRACLFACLPPCRCCMSQPSSTHCPLCSLLLPMVWEILHTQIRCMATHPPACLPPTLPALPPACLPACLPASHPACLPASLPACLPPCLPACLPPCLPPCLPASHPSSLPAALQVLHESTQQHTLLPAHHRAVHLVKRVGMRIAQVMALWQRHPAFTAVDPLCCVHKYVS